MFESLETLTDVQRALRDIFKWRSWTPHIRGDTSDPNFGSTKTIEGRYARVGDLIVANAKFVFSGSGISNGSGNYLVRLPVPATDVISNQVIGNGYILDISGARYVLTVERATATEGFMVWNNTSSNALVNASVPVAAWAANDRIHLGLVYEAKPSS